MDIIIQQIVEKIIKSTNKNLEMVLKEGKGISDFLIETKKILDEIGVDLACGVLEEIDQRVKRDINRKQNWIVKSKDNIKSLATMFGEVEYKRTYYENKKTGEYKYLSDEMLGIQAHDKMDTSLKSKLVEEAIDSPYRKSGMKASDSISLTGQTVMNAIRELGPVENNVIPIKRKNIETELIFIEADEDHVALQTGKGIEPKLVYVHEGRKKISKGRYELQNKRVFSGVYKGSEDLWLEVADYIDEAYDSEKIKKIYLSGDGANWIKQGVGWINKSVYVLDRFHLSKYVKKATAHLPHITHCLWNYINRLEKENVLELFGIILEETEQETKKKAVEDCRRYIINNWDGIKNQHNDDYIGCSAEGHVSHILSDRLSSRPLGWCEIGVDQMARLRAFRANGGNVYELFNQRRKEQLKEERILKLSKTNINRKIISKTANEVIGNIPLLLDGRRTGISQILKSFRGA